MICASCTTPAPVVVTEQKIVKRRIPQSYFASCGQRWSKPGGPATTQDFVDRGDIAEAGWACRDAQLNKIKNWDKQ